MILINFGWCGIKFKRSHEFGRLTEAPFWQLKFIFFELLKFQKGASSRFINYAWNMYNDTEQTKEWVAEVKEAKDKAYNEVEKYYEEKYGRKIEELEKRNESLQRQYSQVYYEKHALQQTIKIINGKEVRPDFLMGADPN